MRELLTLVILMTLAPAARAEVRATLPLQGYYRPGMFMPLNIEGTNTPVEVSGGGVVATQSTGNGIARVLVAESVNQLIVNGAPVEAAFRAVPDGRRLLGLATAKPEAMAEDAIVINLDPLDPVPGPAIAWELLDALVLDAPGAQRIGIAKLTDLLAAGITITVVDEAQPAGPLPWQREGAAWIVRPQLLGPRGSISAAAMLPITGSDPGLPMQFRRNVFLAAALFAILATGVALWRSKRAVIAMAALVAGFVGAAYAWRTQQPTTTVAGGGSIFVSGPSLTQIDEWTSYAAADQDASIPLPIGARPVAESAEALAQLRITFESPAVPACHVPRGTPLAILRRTLTHATVWRDPDPALTSPLAPLAKAVYVRPGVTIVGQVTDNPWPSVVLRAEPR